MNNGLYTYMTRGGHQSSTDSTREFLALEQLRVLVARLDQLGRERPARILAVTSAIASEGKTTIASNLAVVAAKLFGKKTLLVDADFRRPGVAATLGRKFPHGLVEVLKGTIEPSGARWQLPDHRLTVLPLVKADADAAPLLMDPAVRARFQKAIDGFDTVIIDTAPILPLADNNILSELVDGFLFVVNAEQTPRRLVAAAVKTIQPGKFLGFVLNGTTEFDRAAYNHHYYGSRG